MAFRSKILLMGTVRRLNVGSAVVVARPVADELTLYAVKANQYDEGWWQRWTEILINSEILIKTPIKKI